MKRGLSVVFLAALAVGVASCGTSKSAPQPSACASFDAIVAASDYSSSALGVVALDGRSSFVSGVDLGSDPVLSESRGRVFWIDRSAGNLIELDPTCGRARSKTSANDPSSKGSTDPYDVAVAPDGSLWVTRWNVPTLAILNADGTPRSVLDLSPFHPNGNPNPSMDGIAIVDGLGSPPASKAFVALDRLDANDKPTGPSLLLRVDVATQAIESQLALAGQNPFGHLVGDPASPGALFVAAPGNFDAADEPFAGVVRIDVAAFDSKLLVGERDLGGSVAQIAISGACGAAIVADPTPKVNATSLVTFDPVTGAVLVSAARPLIATPGHYDLRGLAWKGDTLLVGDWTDTPKGFAVHVFDRTGACDLRLRPDVVFAPQKPVALLATH